MKESLTLKQRRFVEVYLETGNATEAASRVYNCKNRNTANAIGAENLAKPSISIALSNILDARGPTMAEVVGVFKACFEATKILRDRVTDEVVEVPDYATQLQAVKEWHKLRGLYPSIKHTIEKREAMLNLYADTTPEQLEREEERIIKSIRRLEGRD